MRRITFAPALAIASLIFVASAVHAGPYGAWALISASGGPRLNQAAAIYDPDGDRLIVFGGANVFSGTENLSSGTWALTLGSSPAWSQIAGGGPSARKGPVGVYDPVRRRMIVIGGYDADYRNDVWALSLAGPPAWTNLTPVSGGPVGRLLATAVYDPVRDQVVMFGGIGAAGPLNDTWALQLSGGPPTWQALTPSGTLPTQRYGPTSIYDPVNDRLLMFGGSTGGTELWSLPLATPTAWAALPTAPASRLFASAVYDPDNRRMLVFGGYDGSFHNDLFEFPVTGSPSWGVLSPSGSLPGVRDLGVAVVQTPQHQMVVFGGYNGSTTYADAFTETWPATATTPLIGGFSPAGGQIGDPVSITGDGFTGATGVAFNNTPATFTVQTDHLIQTTVPSGATTGTIRVDTPQGPVTSANAFVVGLRPELDSIDPTSGKLRAIVVLHGVRFTGTTSVRFGNSPGTPYFHVDDDTRITARVDSLATTGPVRVGTIIGVTTSAFTFTVLPSDTIPRIASVRDVPNDQGGKVFVAWTASDQDQPGHRFITGYRVWRRMPPAIGAAAVRAARPDVIRRTGRDGVTIDYWEALATLPATYLDGYAYTAATTQDSLPGGNPYTAFFVQALTTDAFTFYNSPVDSGYSVDNLSPPTPQPFVAVYGPNSVALHWLPSAAPDLAGYRLYRGTTSGFTPGPDNLVASVPDTGYIDTGSHASAVYKLAAVDVHGNASRYALVTPNGPTGTLVSLVSADASAGRVRLVWFASGNSGMTAQLERAAPGQAWEPVRMLISDGEGFMRYDDSDVTVGGRYGYRLTVSDGGQVSTFGEVWVEVTPLGLALSIANPVHGADLTCDIVLRSGGDARLDLLDVAGRRLGTRALSGMGPGLHHVTFATTGVPAGVLLVRLTQGTESQVRRAVVLR